MKTFSCLSEADQKCSDIDADIRRTEHRSSVDAPTVALAVGALLTVLVVIPLVVGISIQVVQWIAGFIGWEAVAICLGSFIVGKGVFSFRRRYGSALHYHGFF